MARSPIPLVILLTMLPVGLIGARLWVQDLVLSGPSGGSGVIEGTEVALSSRVAARVESLPVREGQQVATGDLLVTLDCSEPTAQLQAAEARLGAAEAQLEAARAQAEASHKSSGATRKSADVGRANAEALAAQRDQATKNASRLDAQATDVAPATVEQAHASADALAHQVDAARAQVDVSGLQASAADQQVNAAEAQVRAAEQQVEAARADVERMRLMVGECEVRAPRAGVVETLPWEIGELVPAGAVTVRIVDLSTVTATFYLPDSELAAAKPEGQAVVVADAYPDREFPGVVTTVASAAEFTPRNVQTRTDRDRLVFPVEVTIPNPGGLLRPGMPVDITLPGTEP